MKTIPNDPLAGKDSKPKKLTWKAWLILWDERTEQRDLAALLREGLDTSLDPEDSERMPDAVRTSVSAEQIMFYLGVADGYLETEPSQDNLKTLALSLLIKKFFTFDVRNEVKGRISYELKCVLANEELCRKLFDFFGQIPDSTKIKNFDPSSKHLGPRDQNALKVFLEEFCRNFWPEHHRVYRTQPYGATLGKKISVCAEFLEALIPILYAVGKLDILVDQDTYRVDRREYAGISFFEKFVRVDARERLKEFGIKFDSFQMSGRRLEDFSSIHSVLCLFCEKWMMTG